MNSDPNRTPPSPDAAASAQAGRGLSEEALKRRKLLLKGLGRGAAVVAASVPIKTLAQPTIRLCTVSGVQSNVGSGRTGGTTATCKGNSPTHFQVTTNWAPSSPSPASTFASVFGGGSGDTLIFILTNAPASAEAVWITALLNAHKNYLAPGFEFPYTPAQVLAYYTANDVNAFNFFVMYMQGVN